MYRQITFLLPDIFTTYLGTYICNLFTSYLIYVSIDPQPIFVYYCQLF